MVAGRLAERWGYPLPLPLSDSVSVGAGGVAVLAGSALLLAATGLFRRSGQAPAPWTSTPEIISSGVYRYTRNPMYIGMALLQLGVGIGFRSGWIVALTPLVLWWVYRTAIRHEEAYLESKFGETYTRYRSSVRRWL